jgi:hypothetical protein
MKPDKAGTWEWFDVDGTKRLVEVFDCSPSNGQPYLRVYWWGGYYNVNEETNPCDPNGNNCLMQEWADRWGERVADNNTLPDSELYLFPTPEQKKTMFAAVEK